MTEVSPEELEKYSQSQLIAFIGQQNEQLTRFDGRFRDVVRAYKGLLKEKDALEGSLRALTVNDTSSREPSPRPLNALKPSANRKNGGVSGAEVSEGDTTQSDDDKQTDGRDSEVWSLQQQVVTLTQALATLTEERARTDSSFQQDKKNLLAQHESLTKKLTSEREKADADLSALRQQLCQEQQAREEEQKTHREMLREVQGLLSSERNSRQSLSDKLREMDTEMTHLRSKVAADRTTEYKEQVQKLSKELCEAREQLNKAEDSSKAPSPQVLQLQQELKNLQEESRNAMLAERQRSNEIEEKMKLQSQREEQQVASFESRLSELSAIIGNYDRQREQDQLTIQKLRDRVAHLDSENTALTQAHLQRRDQMSSETAEVISGLQEKISKLKSLLRVATQKTLERPSIPANIEDMSVAEYSDMLAGEPSKKEYQQELSQLKEEFESYKQRAQSVLRSKSSQQETDANQRSFQDLQRQYSDTRQQLELMQLQAEDEKERYSVAIQKLREEMRALHDRHRQQLVHEDLEHKQKLQDIQQHFQTTRERTKKLLEEKDAEIAALRADLTAHKSRKFQLSSLDRHSTSNSSSLTPHEVSSLEQLDSLPSFSLPLHSDSNGDAVQELLGQPSSLPSEVTLFLQAQQQQKQSVEYASLRRKRLDLEDKVRELTEREHNHVEQNEVLKEVIRKLERDRSRETENMEYVKNVVHHFMCSDSYGREQLITPIATILHFTTEEVQEIKRKAASRRWLPAASPK